MMKLNWIVLTAVVAATLTNGCMAFKEVFGSSRQTSSSSVDDVPTWDNESVGRVDESANRIDEAADRSAAAADRADAIAARASIEADKTETRFHKSLHK